MPKYSIIVEYIGTNYSGSQVQPDKVTIQSELNKALSTLKVADAFNEEGSQKQIIKTIFSGRSEVSCTVECKIQSVSVQNCQQTTQKRLG